MVAEAGDGQGLRPWVALACVIFTVAGFLGIPLFLGRYTLASKVGLNKPPQVLAAEARGLLERVGHAERPLDTAHGFDLDWAWLMGLERVKPWNERWRDLSTVRPNPYRFWYRESPRYLVPTEGAGSLTDSNPPVQVPGMANVRLDADGRLLELLFVPPQVDEAEPPWPEPDWEPLLTQAGFVPAALAPARPIWNAPVAADLRAAWKGTYPGQDAIPMHIEAAAYHGKPVFFRVVPPWAEPARLEEVRASRSLWANVIFAVFLIPLGSILILALRNLRLGRGDRKGAVRLSVFLFSAWMLDGLLELHLVPGWSQVLSLARTVSAGLAFAVVFGIVYLALEPYVRRIWPELLISWGGSS